jgi:predicted DNA-binding transcriptional regulator AlpA
VDSLLGQRAAAQLLGISVRTLERHRVAGTGPRFCRLGHRLIRYRKADLEEWVRSSLRTSTSANDSHSDGRKKASSSVVDNAAALGPETRINGGRL